MRKKSIFILLLAFFMCFVSIPASALDPTKVSDEEYLQYKALLTAQSNTYLLYPENFDEDSITITGPYDVYVRAHLPKSELAAYMDNGLDSIRNDELRDKYKLFFVYRDGEPFTYMTLRQHGDWTLFGEFGMDLNILLEEKAKLQEQFPDEEIGYLVTADNGVMLFTPNMKNGYILMTESELGYDGNDKTLVRTRDYAIGAFKANEWIEEELARMQEAFVKSGLTEAEWALEHTFVGGEAHYVAAQLNMLDGRTYPVWQFWLPRIGIPVIVLLILAGAVVLIVRRRKKAE